MAKYNFKRTLLCQSILTAVVLSSLVPVQAKRFGFQNVVDGITQGAGVIRTIRSVAPAGGGSGGGGRSESSSNVSGTVLPSTPTPTPPPPTPTPSTPEPSGNSNPGGNNIFHNYGTEGSRHAYNSGGGATATVVVVNEKVSGRNVHGHPVTRVVSRAGGQRKALSANDNHGQPQPVEPQQHIDPQPVATTPTPPIAKAPTSKSEPETGWVDKMMTNMTSKLQKG